MAAPSEIKILTAVDACLPNYAADSADGHLTGSREEVMQLLTEIMTGAPIIAGDATECDHFTRLMALEVLLPHHQREEVQSQLTAGKTALDIATKYRIPQAWVEFYLLPKYKSLMDDCYAANGF